PRGCPAVSGKYGPSGRWLTGRAGGVSPPRTVRSQGRRPRGLPKTPRSPGVVDLHALRRRWRCSASRRARWRSLAVRLRRARYSSSCSLVNSTPRRAITLRAVSSRAGQSRFSVRAPFQTLQNEGTYFGNSPPLGSRLQKTPALVPVFSRVPSPDFV